jgi:oligoribonuclease NrnB/cAMP/cGMP phosphodiesterase (DHH superfamily)
VLERLKHSGITVVYSALDCASILLYNHFKHKLGREAARLAAYAAVSDRLEDGPLASSLLSWFDRHFIQYEALILAYAVDHKNTDDFRSLVVEELSKFTFPHRIEGVAKTASTHLDYMVKLIKTLPKKAKKLGEIAYVEGTNESSKGTVANLLVDSMGVDIGLCYKIKSDETVNLSIRGKSGLNVHLGETSKKLAEKYNGFGGGHEKASGAKIPQKNLTKFLYDLNSELRRK